MVPFQNRELDLLCSRKHVPTGALPGDGGVLKLLADMWLVLTNKGAKYDPASIAKGVGLVVTDQQDASEFLTRLDIAVRELLQKYVKYFSGQPCVFVRVLYLRHRQGS